MKNLNFWSKFFTLNFWSSRCSRLLRPCTKWRGQKKIKSMSFHQYSWNSEVETTWISLIGWPHKTLYIWVFLSRLKTWWQGICYTLSRKKMSIVWIKTEIPFFSWKPGAPRIRHIMWGEFRPEICLRSEIRLC